MCNYNFIIIITEYKYLLLLNELVIKCVWLYLKNISLIYKIPIEKWYTYYILIIFNFGNWFSNIKISLFVDKKNMKDINGRQQNSYWKCDWVQFLYFCLDIKHSMHW